ncbi:MAG TPA: energy transducer TonB [Blastocatellia bacterium]|nr:energy transducer TonB [Blastocatellia bacterium]
MRGTDKIVAGAGLTVLRTDLLIAERFELRESFFESRSHICVVSELKNRDNDYVHRARPELLVSIEGEVSINWLDLGLVSSQVDLQKLHKQSTRSKGSAVKPLNRIAMFIVVLSLAYISAPAQDKPTTQDSSEPKPRQIWIRLKSEQILTGDLVHMDSVSVEFKVNSILLSVPCDDLIGVMFAPPTPTSTPTSNERIEPMTGSLRPMIIYREKAKYTDKARNNGVEGTVVLEVVFHRYGLLTDINVIRGLPDGLSENAIESAKKTRFQPAVKDGQPISVRGVLEFDFKLQ